MKKLWVTCLRCLHLQEYTAQMACVHCKVRLNNWSVVSQLQSQMKTLQDYRGEYDHEESDVNDYKE